MDDDLFSSHDNEIEHAHTASSPFDAIRKFRPDGTEYWSARALAQVMGYAKWQNFEAAINRASQAICNQKLSLSSHVTERSKLVERAQGGSAHVKDYELSRFAAYLVAMNGDPSKKEVAAAQAYFAIRTREAEVTQKVAPAELTRKQILMMALEAEDRADEERRARELAESQQKMLEAKIEHDAPMLAKSEAHTVSTSAIHRTEYAREVQTWARKEKGLKVYQEDVLHYLGTIGLFVRGNRTDHGQATADAEARGLAYTHKDTLKNGRPFAVGRLTAKGQDMAWRRIHDHINTHGNLPVSPRRAERESA